jgi:hypothetical protein
VPVLSAIRPLGRETCSTGRILLSLTGIHDCPLRYSSIGEGDLLHEEDTALSNRYPCLSSLLFVHWEGDLLHVEDTALSNRYPCLSSLLFVHWEGDLLNGEDTALSNRYPCLSSPLSVHWGGRPALRGGHCSL